MAMTMNELKKMTAFFTMIGTAAWALTTIRRLIC
jgi:hypothetical protein